MNVLETEHLLLRPFREADLDDLADLYADPEVTRFIGSGHPQDRDQVQRRLERMMRHWQEHGFGMWALIHKAEDRFVGRCGVGYLHNRGDAELAYTLARRFWGQGLATEAVRRVLQYAFEVLQLPRVVGAALIENVASQKVMLRAGMVFVECIRYDHKDAYLYAIDNPAGDTSGQPRE
jgi:ribosomal-protein-alanine N-acetyltransferase